jgi:hypothetical protein
VTSVVGAIRSGVLDAELAALLWLLVEGRVPVHVAAPAVDDAAALAGALGRLGADGGTVTSGPGAGIEDVLRQPVPIRPATGAVVIVAGGRVVAVHLHRPPLRDGAGHVRSQAPAVLATRDEAAGRWEHFAWGVTPDLASATGRRAGDFEPEQDRRREFLAALAASDLVDDGRIAAALAGFDRGS